VQAMLDGAARTARRRGTPSSRIQSLDRAMDLLETLAPHGTAGLALKALSAAVALNPSTAHSLLGTLLSRGYVEQDQETGRYRLGASSLTLAQQFMRHCDLAQLALPLLRTLHQRFDELVVLGVLQGGRQHTLVRLGSSRPLVINDRHSDAGALHCTSVGKVLLSGLAPAERDALLAQQGLTAFTPYTLTDPDRVRVAIQEVQETGYAVARQEHFVGLLGLAAPVRGADGRILAGLGLAIPMVRLEPEAEPGLVRAVQETALALSQRLGFLSPDFPSADGRPMGAE
jgi:DNA-binding IclR family transcriptional regulator